MWEGFYGGLKWILGRILRQKAVEVDQSLRETPPSSLVCREAGQVSHLSCW